MNRNTVAPTKVLMLSLLPLVVAALVASSAAPATANEPPTCNITYSPANPTVADIVTFNSGAVDLDGEIVWVAWSFDYYWDRPSTDPATYQYSSTGTHTEHVTVCDDGGACAICYVTLTVGLAEGCGICGPTLISLTGNPYVCWDDCSTVPGGGTIVSQLWYLDSELAGGGAQFCKYFEFEECGTHTVMLCVTGDNGWNGCCSREVEVEPEIWPPFTCGFYWSPAWPYQTQQITFNASDIESPWGEPPIVSWVWDFGDGDGGMGPMVTHAYASAGSFEASLTVVNDDDPPWTETCTSTVWVEAFPCSVTMSPEKAFATEELTFDSNAFDPYGDDITVDWTFGDGETDTGVVVTHTYTAGGRYRVDCMVTNGDGQTTDCYRNIIVHTYVPVACFTWTATGPLPVVPGEPIKFNPTCSTVPDRIVAYAWDFGDGETSDFWSPTHGYPAPGTYTTSLTITDSGGETDSETETFTCDWRPEDLDWNCNLRAYWGSLGGAPSDVEDFLGVKPGATDDYDAGIDMAKSAEPPGCYVYAWFDRPAWGQGPIKEDWRSPLLMASTKEWGTLSADFWRVKTNCDNGPSGVFDVHGQEYPIAASVYLTWWWGVSETPPAPVPLAEFRFTLRYQGGIYPKPSGTLLSDATLPTYGETWNMEWDPHIVIPLWNDSFKGVGAISPDIPKFQISVSHSVPSSYLSCTIVVGGRRECGAPLTFAANAHALSGRTITSIEWDFGDGGTATGDLPEHVYAAPGTYLVICTITDNLGNVDDCHDDLIIIPRTVAFTLTGPAWHMISLPCEPVDPDPAAVFDELDPYGDPSRLSGCLHRFDPIGKTYNTWVKFAPDDFGGPLAVGEGYWLYVFGDVTISYEACCVRGERSITFGEPGWYMIGNPQLGYVDVRSDSMQAELGASGRIPYHDAVPQWIGDPLVGYDPVMSSYYYVSVGPVIAFHDLRPFEGYWIAVNEPGPTIYIPAP